MSIERVITLGEFEKKLFTARAGEEASMGVAKALGESVKKLEEEKRELEVALTDERQKAARDYETLRERFDLSIAELNDLRAQLAEPMHRSLYQVRKRAEAAEAKVAELEAQLAEAERRAEARVRELERQEKQAVKVMARMNDKEQQARAERDFYEKQAALFKSNRDELQTQLKEQVERVCDLESTLADIGDEKRAAEAERDGLRAALVKVEEWFASEEGPICRLWENCEIGDYDDYQTDWPDTLADVRNLKDVDTAVIDNGNGFHELHLYREILAALGPQDGAESEVKPCEK